MPDDHYAEPPERFQTTTRDVEMEINLETGGTYQRGGASASGLDRGQVQPDPAAQEATAATRDPNTSQQQSLLPS